MSVESNDFTDKFFFTKNALAQTNSLNIYNIYLFFKLIPLNRKFSICFLRLKLKCSAKTQKV